MSWEYCLDVAERSKLGKKAVLLVVLHIFFVLRFISSNLQKQNNESI